MKLHQRARTIEERRLRVGIDVGGTNTDAVLMGARRVLAEAKTPTTADVTSGICSALGDLLGHAGVEPGDVQAVMIGTTHFTNAVIEAKGLSPTAAVRLGLPATQGLPPMVDWPEHLRRTLGEHVYLCHGGHEFDGRELSPLDADELRAVAADIASKGLRSIALCSVFSPVNDECEQQAAEILAAQLPGVAISRSHEISRVGLLERENATILNASLRDLGTRIVDALHVALAQLKIMAPVWLSQNDGTLMSIEAAARYPVDHCLWADELHAWGGLPVRPARLRRGRHRRDDDGCRPAPPWVSAPDVSGGRDRRSADQLPDAGRVLVRVGRRRPGAGRGRGNHRAGQCRLRADQPGAGLRRRHRDGH